MTGKRHSLNKATVSTGTFTTTAPSYDFDGTDNYIDLGTDNPSDLTGDITISAWINPSGWGGSRFGRILTNGGCDFFLLEHHISYANTMYFSSDNQSTSPIVAGQNSITLNTWQHILVTRNSAGDETNIYINGVLSGTANQDSGTPIAGTNNTLIGNRDAGDRTFDGQISGMKIFNRVLSASEIDYLYSKEVNKY